MAEPCTIFVLRVAGGARRLVLPAWSNDSAPTFEIEALEKDAAGGERWVKFEPRDKGATLIAMALHYLLHRNGGYGTTFEVGRATPRLVRNSIPVETPFECALTNDATPREAAAPRDAEVSASARMALDSPPVAASASVRMALDTDTEANRKSRDSFDIEAYDLLAARNAASARGEAVQSIEALLAEELRGRYRALKFVDALAKALEAACNEIVSHDAPRDKRQAALIAEWRGLATEWRGLKTLELVKEEPRIEALANALAAACDEISAHDACAATLEGEYAVHRTPPERVAEWRKLAQEQA
jgi:hypothetical protein